MEKSLCFVRGTLLWIATFPLSCLCFLSAFSPFVLIQVYLTSPKCSMKITDDIVSISPRLPEAKRKALKRLGIENLRDLLYHFPTRYEDSSELVTIKSARVGETITVYVRVKSAKTGKTFRSKKPIAEATFEDGTGTI